MTLRDVAVLISMTGTGCAAVDERQVVFVQGVEHQLDSDEGQNGRQSVGKVDEAVQEPVDQEVQLAQAHQGEGRGGENNVHVLRQPENRGDGVEGEQDVRPADRDHDQQHRGQRTLAVDDGEELVAVVVFRGVEELPGDPDHEVVGLVVTVGVRPEQVACGDQQNQAEDVEHPGERIDQRGAQEDESGAGDQREDDAEKQHLLLVFAGHAKARDDDQEDKEVVHGECLLRDVARKVLRPHFSAAEDPHQDTEHHGQAHVEGGPRGRLLERGHMGLADVEEVVERQQGQDDRDGDCPDEGRNCHVAQLP